MKKEMDHSDVLLVNPPSKVRDVFEHLGLGYLAACLRKKDIQVRILNLPTMSVQRALRETRKFSCKLMGVSVPFQDSADLVFSFISGLKRSGFNAHTTIGGIYPTFRYEEILRDFPSIDSVVLGEGEETFAELAEAVVKGGDWRGILGTAYMEDGKIVSNKPRPLIKELDSIPFPERDVLPEILEEKGFAPVLTSRGCYGRCSFCSVVPFYAGSGPRYRLRSSKNVITEMEMLYNKFGVRNFEFNDANFIGGKGHGFDRAQEIAQGILNQNMDLRFSFQCRADDVDEELFKILKRAGLGKVFLGVESGSQSMLDRFRKDITVEENLKALEILGKLDLMVDMGFITFDDRITAREFRDNRVFIQKVKRIIQPNKLRFDFTSKLIPLAGTEAELQLRKSGKYGGDFPGNGYRLDDPMLNLVCNAGCMLATASGKLKRALKMSAYDVRWMKN